MNTIKHLIGGKAVFCAIYNSLEAVDYIHVCMYMNLPPTGVPPSAVISCNDGQLAVRLHFEAEHTNVLVVTAELLNGCLASAEITAMTVEIVNPGIPEFPVSFFFSYHCVCFLSS